MSTSARDTIVAATANPDKLARIRLLIGRGIALRPLPPGVVIDEPSPDGPLAEPGEPLVRVAAAKARSASLSLAGALTIATDGGLVFPALGDRWHPGLTRRFAGPGATNHDRAVALLALADGLTGADRWIVWREAVAVAEEGRIVLTAVAESLPGFLVHDLTDPDGDQGFWLQRLWRADREPGLPASTGEEHWVRLAGLIAPFVRGLAGSAAATRDGDR